MHLFRQLLSAHTNRTQPIIYIVINAYRFLTNPSSILCVQRAALLPRSYWSIVDGFTKTRKRGFADFRGPIDTVFRTLFCTKRTHVCALLSFRHCISTNKAYTYNVRTVRTTCFWSRHDARRVEIAFECQPFFAAQTETTPVSQLHSVHEPLLYE